MNTGTVLFVLAFATGAQITGNDANSMSGSLATLTALTMDELPAWLPQMDCPVDNSLFTEP